MLIDLLRRTKQEPGGAHEIPEVTDGCMLYRTLKRVS
jgi:hypothetical protein